MGKCFGIKARDGEWNSTADIVGEISVEIIDLHTDLDRLILSDARIEIGRNSHDRHNMTGMKQRFGLLGTGLLQAERMRPTHRLVKLLRIRTAIIHHHGRRSIAAADHKQNHEEQEIDRHQCPDNRKRALSERGLYILLHTGPDDPQIVEGEGKPRPYISICRGPKCRGKGWCGVVDGPLRLPCSYGGPLRLPFL